MLFVTPVNKKSHKVERLRTTTVSFPVILFHSKSNQTGYRYRQISVIKNWNIGISAFSHIGASLIKGGFGTRTQLIPLGASLARF